MLMKINTRERGDNVRLAVIIEDIHRGGIIRMKCAWEDGGLESRFASECNGVGANGNGATPLP
jgi:hypothetical protein